MALVDANVLTVLELNHVLPDILRKLYKVNPQDTAVTSMMTKTRTKSNEVEWSQYEDLSDTPNYQPLGQLFDADTLTVPFIRRARHQISTVQISLEGRSVDAAVTGNKKEFARQVMEGTLRLKRMMETAALMRTASVKAVKSSSTAPKAASLSAQMTKNILGGTNRTSPTVASGHITATGTNGTDRAYKHSLLADMTLKIYNNSSRMPGIIVMNPKLKMKYSNFLFSTTPNIAQLQQNVGGKTGKGIEISTSVAYFANDFGRYMLLPDRHATAGATNSEMLFISPRDIRMSFRRPLHFQEMGDRGDAKEGIIRADYGFIVLQDAAVGVIADIDDTEAFVA